MTTLNLQVGAGADDSNVVVSSQGFYNTVWYAYAGHSTTPTEVHSCLRFTGVSGLSGAVVTAAKLSLWGYQADVGTPLTTIYLEKDSAAPSAPTTFADFMGRTLTTAGVNWDDPNLGEAWSDSPDIASVVSELLAAYSNPTVINVFWYGRTSAAADIAYAESYNHDPTQAAKLSITYTTAITPSPISATWSVATPTVVPGAVTVTPSVADAIAEVESPSVVLGDIVRTVDPIAATWSVPDAIVSKIATCDPIAATWSVESPTPTADVVRVPNPIAGSWAVQQAVAKTRIPASPASASWSVETPTVTANVTRTAEPIGAAWAVEQPQASTGITLEPDPIAATWTVAEPTIGRSIAASPAQAAWSVASPGVIVGAVTVMASSAEARWRVFSPRTGEPSGIITRPGRISAITRTGRDGA